MTIWLPVLEGRSGPRYRVLAEALAEDVRVGTLAAGVRLPPQRDLAWRLGVTVGTISRAYALAEQRGLVTAEVGRGTFVRAPAPGPRRKPLVPSDGAAEGPIDLTINQPADCGYREALAPTLAALAERGDALGALMPYAPRGGLLRHREAAATWLGRAGLDVDPARLIITGGTHQAITSTLAALTRPGDPVLAEAVSYAGLRGLASTLHLHLEGVSLDEEGLRPDALEAACQTTGARVLFTIPTLQNPTATTQSPGRREAIAAIARRFDLWIVEDDVYGLLPAARPAPIATLAPERTVFVSGTAKTLAPGLRVGFIVSPEAIYDRITNAGYDLLLSQPALMAEIFTTWVESGTAERLLSAQRAEMASRHALAARVLDLQATPTDPAGFHLWLPLPPTWRASAFAEAAGTRGVRIGEGPDFAVGRGHAPDAIRLSLTAAPDQARLETALRVIADLLASLPALRRGMI